MRIVDCHHYFMCTCNYDDSLWDSLCICMILECLRWILLVDILLSFLSLQDNVNFLCCRYIHVKILQHLRQGVWYSCDCVNVQHSKVIDKVLSSFDWKSPCYITLYLRWLVQPTSCKFLWISSLILFFW